MRLMFFVLMLALLPALTATGQDWRYDSAAEAHLNCSLIAMLKAEYGAENIMKFPDGDLMTLAYFIDRVFTACAKSIEAGALQPFNDEPAEPETDLEISAILEDHGFYSLDEVGCSVKVTNRFDEDLNVSLAGAYQDDMSVDIYSPGESQALTLPNVNRYEAGIAGLTLPARTEWATGNSFPLGRYTFDIEVFDHSYRFQWLRRDAAVNTIVLTCLHMVDESEFED